MDAIRKKMQSLKSETDSLYSIIHNFEEETKEANRRSDQADCDIRDYGKKVHGLEIEFDETCDKLQKASESLEEKAKKSEEYLAGTVTKLATTSKEADNILKKVKCREHLHEQRSHLGGIGQEPEGIHQDGCRQRAEAG